MAILREYKLLQTYFERAVPVFHSGDCLAIGSILLRHQVICIIATRFRRSAGDSGQPNPRH